MTPRGGGELSSHTTTVIFFWQTIKKLKTSLNNRHCPALSIRVQLHKHADFLSPFCCLTFNIFFGGGGSRDFLAPIFLLLIFRVIHIQIWHFEPFTKFLHTHTHTHAHTHTHRQNLSGSHLDTQTQQKNTKL